MKFAVGILVAVLIALGAGWFWGASGRSESDRSAHAAELQRDLYHAHSSVLAARVDLYNVNFGDASRHLEDAKAALLVAGDQLKTAGRSDDATKLNQASARITEAQQMAGRLDQGANARAADAARIIGDVLAAPPR
jgi:hypothetical protein